MQELNKLFDVVPEERDTAWENQFFKAFIQSNLHLKSTEPQPGPDGWPYLIVETTNDADEPALQVVSWLATRGIGLAVNTDKWVPDFVFSYGMIWNFKERGEFISQAPERKSEKFEIKPGDELLTGVPNEAFLPGYVRSILRQFLLDQGVMAPKALMVSVDKINFDLCFSWESLGQPPENEHQGIAEALAWFLPAHYAVSIMSEKVVSGFQAL